MASKAKKERLEAAKKAAHGTRWHFWLMVAFVLALLGGGIWYYQRAVAIARAQQVSILFRLQFANMINNGGLQGRLPLEVRAKLSDIAQRNIQGNLEFRFIVLDHPRGHKTLMSADNFGNKPALNVHAPYYMELRQSEDPQKFETLVAIALIHETIHLERWPLPRKEPTREEYFIEETRAYGRASLEAVRPMRRAGLAIESDFIKLDDVLMSCGDNVQCPQFAHAIKSYLGG